MSGQNIQGEDLAQLLGLKLEVLEEIDVDFLVLLRHSSEKEGSEDHGVDHLLQWRPVLHHGGLAGLVHPDSVSGGQCEASHEHPVVGIGLTVGQGEPGDDVVGLTLDQLDVLHPPQPQLAGGMATPQILGAVAGLELKVERNVVLGGRGVGVVESSIQKYGDNEDQDQGQ